MAAEGGRSEWNKIRRDYIAGKGSYRELSQKYDVPLKTLAMRAKAEGWPELRKQSCHKAATKTVEAVAEAKADMATRVYKAAGMMLDKVLDVSKEAKTAKDIRALTAAIRDIKDITDVRSALDMEEQRARIDALRAKADAGNEDDDDTGVIMLPPRMEDNDG